MSQLHQPKTSLVSQFEAPQASVRSYVIGFVSCIVLTVAAYAVATSDMISNQAAIGIIGGLAIVQCAVQLRRFLHVGSEFKPRWKLYAFLIMLAIVAIFVIGSLWIMTNLNYRMIHSPTQMNEYVESQNGL